MPPEFVPIKDEIENCLTDLSKEAIDLLSLHGGYIGLKDRPYVDYLGLNIAYLNYNFNNIVPDKSSVKKDLAKYVNENAKRCIENVSDVISIGEAKSEVNLLENKVLTEINLPVKLQKKGLTFELKDFKVEFPVRLGKIIDTVNELVNEQIRDRERLCLSCMNDIAARNNLYIQTFSYRNDIIFVVNDASPAGYRFMFASKFG